jgi:hypothetical protein
VHMSLWPTTAPSLKLGWMSHTPPSLKEPDVLVSLTNPASAYPYAMLCVTSQAHTHHAPYAHTATLLLSQLSPLPPDELPRSLF